MINGRDSIVDFGPKVGIGEEGSWKVGVEVSKKGADTTVPEMRIELPALRFSPSIV